MLLKYSSLPIVVLMTSALLVLGACSPETSPPEQKEPAQPSVYTVQGQWLVESDGSIMQDPQTSGLVMQEGLLVSVSDGSALEEQRRRLHFIDPASGIVVSKLGPMSMSSQVRRSCFAAYLSDEPDFEALVVDPNDPNVFILVTEDATRTGALSPRCQERFSQTGSTAYPTLLVRVKRDDESLTMTHVRPLQYPLSLNVGDFPNDGIEAMAFAPNGTLYLGLEKDAAGQPRLFSVPVTADFWQQNGFAEVSDPMLRLPQFETGNHPINGMDYLPLAGHAGLLIAAARNDNQLWLIDLSRQQPTQIIQLAFEAPTGAQIEPGARAETPSETSPRCEPFELMDNASLEGVAVDGVRLWLINDPWKRNYLKNIVCESNRARYEAMSPLIYSLPIRAEWLAMYRSQN
ncbi:hypothetical protein [Alteromonas oceanisediminis]|uniref:hypothetical protein n=1 Tax=Alteromonas oceanisediminis TaxID=2836180 RepID=UPI001BDA0BA0|nr:hypothetical protein [Alteromonas oceanisediminis]MBT0585880.1 hypothetical protein [Alteromonas oceanisediminis]